MSKQQALGFLFCKSILIPLGLNPFPQCQPLFEGPALWKVGEDNVSFQDAPTFRPGEGVAVSDAHVSDASPCGKDPYVEMKDSLIKSVIFCCVF